MMHSAQKGKLGGIQRNRLSAEWILRCQSHRWVCVVFCQAALKNHFKILPADRLGRDFVHACRETFLPARLSQESGKRDDEQARSIAPSNVRAFQLAVPFQWFLRAATGSIVSEACDLLPGNDAI